jgi:hypothetical protein
MNTPARTWNGPDGDDGSVHVVGNGQIAAYGCGPNLFTLPDPLDAWVEYYADGQPQGTRCRPWESAINCLSILKYLRGGRKRQ